MFDVPAFAVAVMDLAVDDFDGTIEVPGSGRIAPILQVDGQARTRVHLGALARVEVRAEEPRGSDPEVALRTRAESHTVHSIRDGGTESRARVTLHVLQGEATHIDLALAEGVTVLSAGGKTVARWEETEGRLRLFFAEPVTSSATVEIAVSRDSKVPARTETLPDLAVLDTTGERGIVVVNGASLPARRAGDDRRAPPHGDTARQGGTGDRRRGPRRRAPGTSPHVPPASSSAWRRRPRACCSRRRPSQPSVTTTSARASTRLSRVDERVPVGDLVFDLPGTDEVRRVTSPGLATWWTEGEGEERTLRLRYTQLRTGTVAIGVELERRLGGRRDAVIVPRWQLRGAKRDRGVLVLFARPDLEPDPGRLPGLRSIPLTEAPSPVPPLEGALRVRAFRWEEPPV